MFLSTVALVSVATAALAAVPGNPPGDGASAVCVLTAAECDAADAVETGAVAPRERVLYATPAEVDCKAAVATVAVNSRADLQLESGDCSPMTSDYRFHISRLPESPAGGSLAPQRVRRSARPTPERSFCNGVPVPAPLALDAGAAQPVDRVAVPELVPPGLSRLSDVVSPLRSGRGSDPPDEPPRV